MDPFASPEPLIRRVYAYAAYRLGDGPAAEDVTSQTFERALRYRHAFDGRRGDAVGWLIGIARRCILDAASTEVPVDVLPEMTSTADLEADAIRRLDLASALDD